MAALPKTIMRLAATAVLVMAGAGAYGQSLDLQLSQSIGIAGAPAAADVPAPAGGYRIAPGDRVSVTVYQEPDLGVSDAKVGTEGILSFPLLGELHVAGLSSQALQRLITERLADGYLKSPSVTVNVDRQQLYFIKGEVESPGGYSYVDGLTVEKAVALAGGFTERAAKGDITLVRESAPDAPMKEAAPSTRVLPGDVITIEESFF
jgi:polysaccharide export outer membrane protein